MNFTEAELDNLSTLARITISVEEKPKMLKDMQAILGYISEINEVEGAASSPDTAHINIVREDVVTNPSGEKTDALLEEAPKTKDGYVEVMQVLK